MLRRRRRRAPPTPASSTTAELTSVERAIWPFLRASSRAWEWRFSVRFSAHRRSQPPSVRTAWATDCCIASPSRVATNGSEAAITAKPDEDLGRQADEEDVHLRHGARDQAEARRR